MKLILDSAGEVLLILLIGSIFVRGVALFMGV